MVSCSFPWEIFNYCYTYVFSSVSQVADSHRKTATNGHSDSYSVTQASSQPPPYTSTPLSTKTELRSARDHVVDVRQQNTVVPPPQQAHARSDKPSKFETFKISVTFNNVIQAGVVWKVDNSIHWINHYPTDSVVCFVNTCPLERNLSSG